MPCSVPHYPEEDSKLRASNAQVRRGGNVSNSLEVLAQLATLAAGEALQLYLLSPLPQRDSPAVKSIRSSFGPDESVVDIGRSFYRPGHHQPASSYIIRCSKTGSRTIVNYNDLPEMTLDEFVAVVNDVKAAGTPDNDETWWHFEVGCDMANLKP